MMNKRAWLIAGTAATALFLAGCASTPAAPKTVAQAIAANPQLTTLNKLINDNDLAATLNSAGPFTVFAPTDEAFKAVPARTWESLSKDKDRVAALLKFHVVPGTMTSDIVRNGTAATLNGATVALSKSGTFVTVEDAVVTTPDLKAGNGVVHVVDRVLTPPAAK
jgi:uncharacterized surface protein with fasciclin (FAS1) repeats